MSKELKILKDGFIDGLNSIILIDLQPKKWGDINKKTDEEIREYWQNVGSFLSTALADFKVKEFSVKSMHRGGSNNHSGHGQKRSFENV